MTIPKKRYLKTGQPVFEDEITDIWNKMPNESPKAYDAFVRYKNLVLHGRGDEKRCLRNVCKMLGYSCKNPVSQWSSKYNWVERALAWDDHLQKIEDDERKHAAREAGRRHVKIGKTMQAIGMQGLEDMYEQIKAGKKLGLKPREIKDFLVSGVEIERGAIGADDKKQQLTAVSNIKVVMPAGYGKKGEEEDEEE